MTAPPFYNPGRSRPSPQPSGLPLPLDARQLRQLAHDRYDVKFGRTAIVEVDDQTYGDHETARYSAPMPPSLRLTLIFKLRQEEADPPCDRRPEMTIDAFDRATSVSLVGLRKELNLKFTGAPPYYVGRGCVEMVDGWGNPRYIELPEYEVCFEAKVACIGDDSADGREIVLTNGRALLLGGRR